MKTVQTLSQNLIAISRGDLSVFERETANFVQKAVATSKSRVSVTSPSGVKYQSGNTESTSK